jgi:glyoxylase-like metal-dependent hydrolase (beta-lactamase superfamily II)
MGRSGPDVTVEAEVAPGIRRVALPTRSGWLPEVNAYLISGPDGLLLIDTGVGVPEGMAALSARLAELNHRVEEIALILITHAHPDHVGLAAVLAERSGAKVRVHAAELPFLDTATVPGRRRLVDEWYRRHGLADDGPVEWRGLTMGTPSRTSPLADGDTIRWGDVHLEVIWTPGHSPGLLCLFDAANRVLISSDHVLEDITPHVGLHFEQPRDPLREYLESLDRVGRLAVDVVLPGHGKPFGELSHRVAAIKRHHRDRCTEIRAVMTPAGQSATVIACQLTWVGRPDGWVHLDRANRGSALAETLAHLRLMERDGEISGHDHDGAVSWTPR